MKKAQPSEELSLTQTHVACLQKELAASRAECDTLKERLKARDQDYRMSTNGEITMKQFRENEAKRLGLGQSAIANRLMRGKYPYLVIRRVNRRVVFVSQ